MERLTKRLEDGQAIMDCARCREDWTKSHSGKDMLNCTALYCRNRLKDRLAAYDDTGLTPEEVSTLVKDWTDLCTIVGECGGISRVRALYEADKEGRLVELPCQSGEHVFALLDNRTHVWECEVEHAVLDGWRNVFAIRPLGHSKDSYYAPFGAFGQSVFLTREEAEAALEAMKK